MSRGGARKGAGRPPLPPDERRSARVMVPMTDQERADLDTQRRPGESRAAAVRRLIATEDPRP